MKRRVSTSRKDVVVLGSKGFGALTRIAEAVRNSRHRAIGVVDSDCPERHLSQFHKIIVCEDICSYGAIQRALLENHATRDIAGIASQFDFLTFAYVDLVRSVSRRRADVMNGLLRCRVKPHLRKLLSGSRRTRVPYYRVRSPGDCRTAIDKVGLPCIAKPIAGAGSFAVRSCSTAKDLARYVAEFPDLMRERAPFPAGMRTEVDGVIYRHGEEVLVEKCLDGPELTCDGFVYHGRVSFLLFQEIFLTDAKPSFLDIGFISPPVSVDAETLGATKEMIGAAVRRLGLDNQMFHVEVKVTSEGPKIVDFNPRFGGGPIAQIARGVTGIEPAEIFVDLACGRRPQLRRVQDPAPPGTFYGYCTLFAETSGIVGEIHGLDQVARMAHSAGPPIVATYPGERIWPFLEKRYVAFALFKSTSSAEVIDSIEEASRVLKCDMRRERGFSPGEARHSSRAAQVNSRAPAKDREPSRAARR